MQLVEHPQVCLIREVLYRHSMIHIMNPATITPIAAGFDSHTIARKYIATVTPPALIFEGKV